eukprot:7019573-Pyramimonas_sp.AAC.1
MRACLAALAATRVRVLHQPLRGGHFASGLRRSIPKRSEPLPAARPEQRRHAAGPEGIVCESSAKRVSAPVESLRQS